MNAERRDLTGVGSFNLYNDRTGVEAPSWGEGETPSASVSSDATLTEINDCVADLQQRPQRWIAHLRDLGEPDYELAEPLLIVIEEYPDDSVVARHPELEASGHGQSEAAALQALRDEILDLYDELADADPNSLGPLLLICQRILLQLIRKA